MPLRVHKSVTDETTQYEDQNHFHKESNGVVVVNLVVVEGKVYK